MIVACLQLSSALACGYRAPCWDMMRCNIVHVIEPLAISSDRNHGSIWTFYVNMLACSLYLDVQGQCDGLLIVDLMDRKESKKGLEQRSL
jgi:hypothetical protein